MSEPVDGRRQERLGRWPARVLCAVTLAAALVLTQIAALPAPTSPSSGPGVAVQAPAPPAPPALPSPGTIDLTGTWRFKGDWAENGLSLGWQKPDFDDSSWRALLAPGNWEDQGVKTANPKWPQKDLDDGYNGYAWYRRHFQVPSDWGQSRVNLRIGAIDDMDWTYINGQLVGSTTGDRSFEEQRDYKVPAGVLKPGADNLIAIRVLDMAGKGGILEGPVELEREARTPPPTAAEEQPAAEGSQRHEYTETRGDMVQVVGSVTVPESVKVNGDAVAVGGSADVKGYVTGSVVAVGGSVRVRSGARVDGDVTAVGGSVRRDEDAVIKGSVTQVTLFPWAMPGLGFFAWPFSVGQYSALNEFLRRVITWGILGLILALLLPKRLEVMARALPLYPGWVAAHGVVGTVMTPAVLLLLVLVTAAMCVVLAVTIIGIALIPAVALLLVAAVVGIFIVACMGLGGVWLGLGQVVTLRFSLGNKGVLPAVLLGVLITAAASVVPVIGLLVVITLLVFAYGVALMTGLGARPEWSHPRLHIPGAPEVGAGTEAPAA